MANGPRFYLPFATVVDNSGATIPGAELNFYLSASDTPTVTYADYGLTTLNPNPMVADAGGRFGSIFLDPNIHYKAVLTEADNGITTPAVIWTADPVIEAWDTGSTPISSEYITLAQFGGVGDGVTDNHAAVAAASAYCTLTGQELHVGPGNYLINTDGGSILLAYIKIQGAGPAELAANNQTSRGSVLSFIGTTYSPFTVNAGTTLDGLVWFYPQQVDSPTPIVYPPMLSYDTANGAVNMCYFRNNAVINAYRALAFNSANGSYGHIWIEDNGIYGILTDIEFATNHEQIYIKNNDFTFGMFQGATEGGLRGFSRANRTIITYPQGDGLQIVNNLLFGALYGVKAADTGLTQDLMISLNYFGQVRYGVIANQSGGTDGWLLDFQMTGNNMTCFNAQNTALQSNCIRITTNKAGVRETATITGNQFTSTTEDGVYISGDNPARDYEMSSNTNRDWAKAKAAGSYGALNITGALTNIIVFGGDFYGQGNAYSSGILIHVNNLMLVGAKFDKCFNVIKSTGGAGGRLTHGLNTSFTTGDTVSDSVTVTTNINLGNNYDKPSTTTTRTALQVRSAVPESFPADGHIPMRFATINFDEGGEWGGVNNDTFTATVPGRRLIQGMIQDDGTGTSGETFVIALDPSVQTASKVDHVTTAGTVRSVPIFGLFNLAAGETVQMTVVRSSGTHNLTTSADAHYNYLTASLVE